MKRLLTSVMNFDEDEYDLTYFRRVEVYVALAPWEAHRLATALGGTPHRGAGKLARKEYLAETKVSVAIKERTERNALLTLYRIAGGATAAFRLELALAGKVAHRDQFATEDVCKLADVLLELLDEHSVTPQKKPARWEPCGRDEPARDQLLSRLGRRVYRGRRPKVSREGCHYPNLALVALDAGDPVPFFLSPRTSGKGIADPGRKPHPQKEKLWQGIAQEIVNRPGTLSEIVLGEQEDPGDLLDHLLSAPGLGRVGVGAFSLCIGQDDNLWHSVRQAVIARRVSKRSEMSPLPNWASAPRFARDRPPNPGVGGPNSFWCRSRLGSSSGRRYPLSSSRDWPQMEQR